jgi:hypothetical protein
VKIYSEKHGGLARNRKKSGAAKALIFLMAMMICFGVLAQTTIAPLSAETLTITDAGTSGSPERLFAKPEPTSPDVDVPRADVF